MGATVRENSHRLARDAPLPASFAASGNAVAGKAAATTDGAKGGRRGGNKPWQNVSVVGGVGARHEAGLSIKTCFDEPASAPASTAAESAD